MNKQCAFDFYNGSRYQCEGSRLVGCFSDVEGSRNNFTSIRLSLGMSLGRLLTAFHL